MSSPRERRSSRPSTTTNGTKPLSSSAPNGVPVSRRSPPRDGYYAGGEFDDHPQEPLTPTSMDGGSQSFPGDDIYPSATGGGPSRLSGGAVAGPSGQIRGATSLPPPPAAPAPPSGQTQRVQAARRVQTAGGDDSPKSRPQSYAGSVHRDEYSPTRSGQQPSSSSRNGGGHYRRSSNAPRTSSSSAQQQQQQQQQPSNGTRGKQQPAGNNNDDAVSRLESPSIVRSVLQPLEKKMNEYKHLMAETQTELAQLDDQLRLLQDRRQRTEERYAEAKGKHDDYERQHHDVGRALRGELLDEFQPRPLTATGGGGPLGGGGAGGAGGPAGRPFSPPVYPQMHQPMTPPHVGFQDPGRPMSGGANSSRTTQKLRTRDRFRMSLFGRG